MLADGVGGGHKRRVHEIRAQLVLAAAIFLVAAHADVLVDLGARIETLLLLRGQRRCRDDRRRPPRPIQLGRHVLRERARSHRCPTPASSTRPVRRAARRHDLRVTATRPPGALSPGRPPPPPPRPPRPRPPAAAAPGAGRPASRPCSNASRCHSGCDASAMTSIARCTRGDVAALRDGRRQHRHRLGRRTAAAGRSSPAISAPSSDRRRFHALQAADRRVDDDRIRAVAREQRRSPERRDPRQASRRSTRPPGAARSSSCRPRARSPRP